MFGLFKKKEKSGAASSAEPMLSLDDARAMEKQFLHDLDGDPNVDCLKEFMIRSTDFMVDSDRIPGVDHE